MNSDFGHESAGNGRKLHSKKNDTANDPLLPEKKRARRRLIGALTLALAVIVGLPMFFANQPKTAQNKPPILQLETNSAIHTLKSENSSAALAASTNSKPANILPATKPTLQTSSTVIVQHPPSDPLMDKKSTIRLTPEQIADGTRAKALLEGLASPQIVLQVAALTESDKADHLQKKLNVAGLHAWVEKISTDSGSRFRVRVGPFPDEQETKKAQAHLEKLGLTGTITKP